MNKSRNSGSTLYIAGITVVAALGGLLFGFDSGVVNGTVQGLQTAFNSTSVGTGFNVASILLGCAVGAFFAGRLADKFGRKTLMIISGVFFIVSAWGSGISDTSLEFVLYRIIGGLAVGAASVMCPTYISEVAPARLRGRLASMQQVAIIVGLFLAFVSNYFIANLAGSSVQEFWLGFEAWRWMYWVELIPAFLFLFGLFFIPESPRYYVINQQHDDALDVLTRLYGMEAARKKITEIKGSIAKYRHKPRLSDLFDSATKKIKPIIWVGLGLAALQQLVGINVVFYYGAVLWQAVGFSESNALLINIVTGAISIGAVVVAILLIDKIGRKPLLKWGSIGMAVSLLVLTYAFFTGVVGPGGDLQLSDTMGIVALISAMVYVAFFNGTWGPVMWVMLGEMFPNQIRGSAIAVSGVSQWLTNFTVTLTFPFMLASIGLSISYGIYAAFAIISILFVVKFVPETKGRELEDMDDLWLDIDKSKARKAGDR